jgi:hypothetical protein
MKPNKIVHDQILQVVDNQIRDKNPPEAKQTYNRLIKMGYSAIDAKKYIGQCVAVEIFNIMKHNQPFDEKRYVQNLLNLPKEPFE